MKKIIKNYSGKLKRLDSLTKEFFPHLSRSELLCLIKSGHVTVDGRKAKKGLRVKGGETLVFDSFPDQKDVSIKANPQISFKVLYEDPWVIAVEKPRGMPTHPNSYRETGTLANGLIVKYPELKSAGFKKYECGLLNRLDNDTSGIVMAARSKKAFNGFKKLFKEKKVEKEYLALVIGKAPSEGSINSSLAHDPKNKKKMKIAKTKRSVKNILKAKTRFKTLKFVNGYSLVLISLTSAVTHQIRAHMASIGHPLVGDKLYQGHEYRKMDIRASDGQFLHASSIVFKHPITGEKVKIKSKLPLELNNLLER